MHLLPEPFQDLRVAHTKIQLSVSCHVGICVELKCQKYIYCKLLLQVFVLTLSVFLSPFDCNVRYLSINLQDS